MSQVFNEAPPRQDSPVLLQPPEDTALAPADTKPHDPTSDRKNQSTSLFASKPYILFVVSLAIFIDSVAYSILIPFLPFVTENLGLGQVYNGVIMAAFASGLVLGAIGFGYLTDHSDTKRSVMLYSLFFLTSGTLLIAFFPSLWSILVGRFIQGCASGGTWSAGLAIIADAFDQKEMGKTLSSVLMFYTIGGFVGPLVGGALYEHIGYSAPFFFLTALVLIDFIGRIVLVEPVRIVELDEETWDIAAFLHSTHVVMIIILTICVGAVLGILELTISLRMAEEFGFTSDLIGYSFTGFVIGQVAAAPIAGMLYDKTGFRVMMIPSLAASGLSLILFGIPMSAIPFIISMTIISALFMFALSPLLPELSAKVPSSAYGKAYGFFNAAFSIGLLVGPFLGSLIYQYFSFSLSCVFAGALFLINIPVVFFYPTSPDKETDVEA